MTTHLTERSGLTMCSAEYNRIFLNVLQDKGVDISKWLQKAHIDFEIMNKLSGFMLYRDVETFFTRNIEPLGIDGLGLAVGERTDITSHGSLAYTVLSSPSYLEGFQAFQRFMKLRSSFITFSISLTEDEFTFNFVLTEKMTPNVARFYLECAISGTYTFIGQYLKNQSFPAHCVFNYSEPHYREQYVNRFGNNVVFNGKTNSLTVDRSLLAAAETSVNPSIFSLAKQQCESDLQQFEQAECIVTRIRNLLFESPWYFPPQEEIANQFSMSIRTLRRKLNDAGTTYQAVLDSIRESLAKDYLKNSQWTISEIADMLGYSEPSNFKRAFKRWSGFTPSEFRAASPANPDIGRPLYEAPQLSEARA